MKYVLIGLVTGYAGQHFGGDVGFWIAMGVLLASYLLFSRRTES